MIQLSIAHPEYSNRGTSRDRLGGGGGGVR